MTSIVRQPMTASSLALRELATPYGSDDPIPSVATPSCCSCCCCVTALVVAPAALGMDTHSVALKNGRSGVLPGVLAGFALPVPMILGVLALTEISSWLVPLVVLLTSVGLIATARHLAGQGGQRAVLWGVVSVTVWALLFMINLVIDIPLWLATYGVGAIVEIALIPLWIVLIRRRIRDRRLVAMAARPQRPVYESLPTASRDVSPSPAASSLGEPPLPPNPDEWELPTPDDP